MGKVSSAHLPGTSCEKHVLRLSDLSLFARRSVPLRLVTTLFKCSMIAKVITLDAD